MVLVAPLLVPISKNKFFSLNLNQYRNTYFQSLNKAKIAYKEAVRDQVLALTPYTKPIHITYTLYPKTKRLCDVANICSIHDKFFSDALVELGRIKEDNFNHVVGVTYLFGEIDPLEPRVEITIQEV